jgi:Zn-finger nucleic acid-binding protein
MRECPVASVSVDECLRCGGVWFECGEFTAAKDEMSPDLNWIDCKVLPSAQALVQEFENFSSGFDWLEMDYTQKQNAEVVESHSPQCPECNTRLHKLVHSGTRVEMDVCRKCQGVWLGQGEFEKILAEMRECACRMSPQELAKEIVEEIKDVFVGEEPVGAEFRDLAMVIQLIRYKLFTF